jgi:hypothetical protein
MYLPHRSEAYVPPQKLAYLLKNPTKQGLFRSLGYNDENVHILEQSLLVIARTQPVIETSETPYGTSYVIEGHLNTPERGLWVVRTVWFIDRGTDIPRFITARPPKGV